VPKIRSVSQTSYAMLCGTAGIFDDIVLVLVVPPRPLRLSQQFKSGQFSRSDVQTASVDGPSSSSLVNGVDVTGRLEDAEWYWGDISRCVCVFACVNSVNISIIREGLCRTFNF